MNVPSRCFRNSQSRFKCRCMTGSPRFVHVRVSSEYSLLQGAMRLKELPAICAEHGMPAVAITDKNNMFGALEFSTLAAAKGIQPIHGCVFSFGSGNEAAAKGGIPEVSPIVLLAQNEEGYGNLLKLNTRLYLAGDRAIPLIGLNDLSDFSAGLICLTGGPDGPVGRPILEGRQNAAEEILNRLAALFPDRLYVELQRHDAADSELAKRQARTEKALVELAYSLDLPLVATNDVHFASREQFEGQDALMCIASGSFVDQKSNRKQLTPEHYFKSQDEMARLFEDLPEALGSTVEIARRCSYRAQGRDPILPKFTENESEELRRQARAGLEERLQQLQLAAPEEEYRQRLEFELDVIVSMGFSGYFLIVADFIKWAKREGIPVGPGRGSGAGSLVAFALTITNLDPLRFSLLFERFLNPERISMPDFDIDFCQDRRDEVIQYVQSKFGEDRVAHIITFGGLLARAAVRDVGRVLRMPYSQVDRIAKMIPRDGARMVSLEEALQTESRLSELRDSDEVVARLFRNAGMIEGLLRNASTHAAGVVIGDRPLDELVPLYKDSRSNIPATQFSMKWAEAAGLVKFDFLGLKTLTVIKRAVDLLKKDGFDIDIDNLAFDDKPTYELCASGETAAVFQLESSGMKDALRMMNPNSIEDLVALIALYRPGPMENIPEYCQVKNKKKSRKRQHELIDDIVAETHGIIVYQEQVMQIAQALAGYSLAEADLLRRAIGKKIRSDMEAEKPKFLAGTERKGVGKATANEVWELMARFAEYGFNKAHAAAYAVLVYQTAWLKAHHPAHFFTAVMNCDIGDTDKLQEFVREVKRLDIRLLAPCVNRSHGEFSIKDGVIHYGLGALKNVGVEVMNQVASARGDQPFADLCDFADRVDLKSIGKRQLETLTRAGSFDCLELNRNKVIENLDVLVGYSATVRKERDSGQMSLFGGDFVSLPPPRLSEAADWSNEERIDQEHQAMGFYFSGHPLSEYMDELREEGVVDIADLPSRAREGTKSHVIAGVVNSIRKRMSQARRQFAFVEVSDATGKAEVTVFAEKLEEAGDRLEIGSKVMLVVDSRLENERLSLLAEVIRFLPAQPSKQQNAAETQAAPSINGFKVYFNACETAQQIGAFLRQGTVAGEGGQKGAILLCPVFQEPSVDAEIEIPGSYPVNPKVRDAIKNLAGVQKVEEF